MHRGMVSYCTSGVKEGSILRDDGYNNNGAHFPHLFKRFSLTSLPVKES